MAYLIGMATIGIIGTAATNILMKNVTSTMENTRFGLGFIMGSNLPYMNDVKNELVALDLDFFVNVLSLIIGDLSEQYGLDLDDTRYMVSCRMIDEEDTGEMSGNIGTISKRNEAIKSAIMGLDSILQDINRDLLNIASNIKIHNKKYFNKWRGFSSEKSISSIKKKKKILEHRYRVLLDVLKMQQA